ncbi:MAG TPA: hypothetical protein VGJ95_22500, partial [Pseudonocardiaceae bacterium]
RRSPQQAAQPVLMAATDPDLAGRTNLWITEKSRIGEPSKTARDDDLGSRVYQRIAALVDEAPRGHLG